MAIERTLIIIKPDGVQRNLVGEIISRFERRGLKIAGLKLMQITQQLAETHSTPERCRCCCRFHQKLLRHMFQPERFE